MKPKLIGGTCLAFSLNQEQSISYFKKFGEFGWLDIEAMALRSVLDMDGEEIKAFSEFTGENVSGYSYLIFLFN